MDISSAEKYWNSGCIKLFIDLIGIGPIIVHLVLYVTVNFVSQSIETPLSKKAIEISDTIFVQRSGLQPSMA